MPRTKAKPRPKTPKAKPVVVPDGDVLTLAEAAAYLRLSAEDVLRLIHEQSLPGRRLGADWRFLKAALQNWLKGPSAEASDFWTTQAGAFRDDPNLDEMVKEIYRQRRAASTEAG